jgi:hypothetical protein
VVAPEAGAGAVAWLVTAVRQGRLYKGRRFDPARDTGSGGSACTADAPGQRSSLSPCDPGGDGEPGALAETVSVMVPRDVEVPDGDRATNAP